MVERARTPAPSRPVAELPTTAGEFPIPVAIFVF
jgi:hypothetical protein